MTQPIPNTKELAEALCAADSILGLLHYRGLVDSEWNREDVAKALDKVTKFRPWYEARLREAPA